MQTRFALVALIGLVGCGTREELNTRSTAQNLSSGFTGSWSGNGNNPFLMLLTDGRVAATTWASGTLFSPATDTWTSNVQPPSFLAYSCAAPLPGAQILMAGGGGAGGTTTAEIFSSATNAWTTTGTMNVARSGAACAALPDGRVLVVGGGSRTAEIYNPSTGTWSPTSSLPLANHLYNQPTVLLDGRILFSDYTPEVFNPATGLFTAVGTLQDARSGDATVRLHDGRVLLTGGQPVGSSAIFNPSTNTFSSASNLITPRFNHAGVLLPSGQVMISGGTAADGTHSLTDVELYDPRSNTWTASSPLLQAREQHSMVVLQDGSTLVVGGSDRLNATTWQTLGGANGAEISNANTLVCGLGYHRCECGGPCVSHPIVCACPPPPIVN